MKNQIFKNRIKCVRKILAAKKFDAAVLAGGSNVRYLSGFDGEDSLLIVTGKGLYLITDSRYTLQAKKQCPACRIIERKTPMTEAVCDMLGKIRGVKTACIEDKVEVQVFNSLRKKLSVPLKPISNLVESVRQIKDCSEIAAIRKAGEIAQRTLEKILPRICLGVRESELAAMLDYELRKSGAAPAFETIVAFGSNSAMPHHRPSSRRLKKIDTILIDFGAKLNGYCCDMTRCFAVGKVNKFYEKVYRTVFAAQQAALKAVKAEQSPKVVDNAAKEIIKSAKLPIYGHGTGHGLGLDVHELPTVSAFSEKRGQTPFLRSGNIITIEPAVYLPGKFGIRLEDDVLVTENGGRVLSSMLKNDETPTLNPKS